MQAEIDALRAALRAAQAEREDARRTASAVFDLIDMLYVGPISDTETKKLNDHIRILRTKVDGWST